MAALVSDGYRSVTEYLFPEEKVDAICRIAGYHRKDFPWSVIWFSPREHECVRPSIATVFDRSCDRSLGSLDLLPVELLHEICLYLDMHSLLKLRQTNNVTRRTVDSVKQYQRVVAHGLNLLCALLRTRLAANITLFDLDNALCTKACAFCGDFAGFISLLKFTRCCFECLQTAAETQVRTVASIRKRFELTKADLAQLTSFKTLPGQYSMEESTRKGRVLVTSLHQVESMTGRDSEEAEQPRPSLSVLDQIYNFMGCCALPYFDRRTHEVEHGICCAGCQLALEKYIIGSRCEPWALKARDKVYAKDEFLEHFRWCEQAQLLWESSDGGQKIPVELPEAARKGGYFNKRG